ncbi:MAG TPA: TOMM precursor leader peptide-binding protein [Chloroflexota bacterium]
MSGALAFKPQFHVDMVEGEGVYLLSEQGCYVLQGALYEQLAPLLDGHHTADDLIDALAAEATPAEVYYALDLLTEKGYVGPWCHDVPVARAAFWSGLGADPSAAERRLQATRVAVATFGGGPPDVLQSELAALGVRVAEPGDFAVALTDDYLHEGLAEFNAAALAAGRPWLLVKPLGAVAWIGPVFRPGQSACWECLAQRLRSNRDVEAYLHRRQGTRAPSTVARAALPSTLAAALQLAATETAKAIVLGADPTAPPAVLTLDMRTLDSQRHAVFQRSGCLRCGNLPRQPARTPPPIILTSQPKRFTADGGHRVSTPEETLARYAQHVSPISGAVKGLIRLTDPHAESGHVYVAGHNTALSYDNLHGLRRGLRSSSGGKGVTDAQARASALCEALERYSGVFQGDEPRRRASYRELGARAIHPSACLLFSDAQYARRAEHQDNGSPFHRIPAPFDEASPIDWTPVWSLTARAFKYLPTLYCYYRYPLGAGTRFCWADSNGCAAGNTLEEAMLQGLLELVERDSVALWWYNRLRRPAVALESFSDPYLEAARAQYQRRGRTLWALDLTSDLGIPAFAAVSAREPPHDDQVLFGFGAHLDPRIGLLRALTELNQMLTIAASWIAAAASAERPFDDSATCRWWQSATLANQPYLVPDDGIEARTCADYDQVETDDLCDDVLRCQRRIEQRGLEVLVLDQTRVDIGLPVVKVVVPGLRHFWARFAPGRLYDVPVAQGWLPRALTEDQLNPIPMFL